MTAKCISRTIRIMKPRSSSAPTSKITKNSQPGFFENLLSSLFFSGDLGKEKRRLLRNIAKTLKQSRQKLYNPRMETILPAFAQMTFDVYKILAPARSVIQRSSDSKVLRSLVVESFFTDEQKSLKDGVSEERLKERCGPCSPDQLAVQVNEELKRFHDSYNREVLRAIELCGRALNEFIDLIHFDFYFMLKKFDSGLVENDFQKNPHFEDVPGEQLIDELKDFYDLLVCIDLDVEWGRIFDILKKYRNAEVIQREAWVKLFGKLRDLKRTGILEAIIRYISADPFYQPEKPPSTLKLVDQYITLLKARTEFAMRKILSERKNQQRYALTDKIFGSSSVSRLVGYTENNGKLFRKNMMEGFLHAAPLNYSKAFLVDYFKTDIREFIEHILFRGKWSDHSQSQQLSDAFHQLSLLLDNLVEFDTSLAEDGDAAINIRNQFLNMEKDKKLAAPLRKMLTGINSEAKRIFITVGKELIKIGKILKALLDDYQAKTSDVITNWREVESQSSGDIRAKMIGIYQKIYHFVQLLNHFTK